MSYADQSMSSNRITALIIVAIIHVALGYALVTGLAYEAVQKAAARLTTIDIKEEVKKEEPPPPPPKRADMPPPPVKVFVPKPLINIPIEREPTPQSTSEPAPPPPPPPPLPPPPAAPRFTPKSATPKGSGQGNWVTQNDYPSRALREEREGVTGYRVSIGPDGKVTDCQVTNSSGSPDLDEATCANVRRRARFNPAMDGDGQPTNGSFSGRVRWQIPKD